jgi:nitrate reductase NapE component
MERFVVLHVGREKVFFFLIFAIFSAILVSMMGTHKKIIYVLQCVHGHFLTSIAVHGHFLTSIAVHGHFLTSCSSWSFFF